MLERLITAFDDCFYVRYNTRLIKGDSEPIYYPADQRCDYHRVVFAHGYFASGLHEIAHWCIAGEARRELVDYGYWYVPDGRNAEQQQAFEQVEIQPQAMEWMFSLAAGQPFRISVDNLNGQSHDGAIFKQAVYQQVLSYCQQGLPERAAVFHDALIKAFNSDYQLQTDNFSLQSLK